MNRAQKRAWLTFGISAVTLLITVVVLLYARANGIIFIDFERVLRMRMFSALLCFPLILIVFIEQCYRKRDFDERDKVIYRKSAYPGYIAGFIFMLGAGFILLAIVEPLGKTTNIYLWVRFCTLLYLSFFATILASSLYVLMQYKTGGTLKGEAV